MNDQSLTIFKNPPGCQDFCRRHGLVRYVAIDQSGGDNQSYCKWSPTPL